MTEVKRVAVIGAGPAGLITASELIRSGLEVVVFEQREVLGGTWALQSISNSPDIRENNRSVFSATYPGMKVNFPRQLMGFSDYPCNDQNLQSPVIFPGQEQIHDFLARLAQKQGVTPRIRHHHQLKRLHCQTRNGKDSWLIETEQQGVLDEPFDAVLFCTGRYSEPVIPEIAGAKEFTGKIIHSLSYRGPEPYKRQRVAVVGTGPSGEDTSRQISMVADRVFVCAREGSYPFLNKMKGNYGSRKNITRQEDIASLQGNQILLTNGKVLKDIDTLILSTGYQINSDLFANVPFLSVIDDKQSLWPLYLHLFHPEHPTLGVIGLPRKTVPFILFEYQAQLAAGFLSGKIKLPSHKAMMYACTQMYLRNQNPECIHEFVDCGWSYYRTLAALIHRTAPPESVITLFDIQREHRKQYPEDYRDVDHPDFI